LVRWRPPVLEVVHTHDADIHLPEHAYTATVLAGLAVSAVAYSLAVLWLRRLPYGLEQKLLIM
jgi:hypothetical protein